MCHLMVDFILKKLFCDFFDTSTEFKKTALFVPKVSLPNDKRKAAVL